MFINIIEQFIFKKQVRINLTLMFVKRPFNLGNVLCTHHKEISPEIRAGNNSD